MRVVCIQETFTTEARPIKIGTIYNVCDTHTMGDRNSKGKRCEPGLYYNLIETGHWYHNSLFVTINEDQKDETEFERECNSQTAAS